MGITANWYEQLAHSWYDDLVKASRKQLEEIGGKVYMSAFDVQEGGDHYKDMEIQPMEFFMANQIPYAEAAVIKYVCRWRKKNGVEDLKKARHIIDMLIEYESDDIEYEKVAEEMWNDSNWPPNHWWDPKNAKWIPYTFGDFVKEKTDDDRRYFGLDGGGHAVGGCPGSSTGGG